MTQNISQKPLLPSQKKKRPFEHGWRKRAKQSTLWQSSAQKLQEFRQEFLEHGYTYMVQKYKISRSDLRRILGKKPRTYANPFYRDILVESVFEERKQEYLHMRTDDFIRKYHIGSRQARILFGMKQAYKCKPKAIPKDPYRKHMLETVMIPQHNYWQTDAYWQERGVIY